MTLRCVHCGVEIIVPGGVNVGGGNWSHVTMDGDRRACMRPGTHWSFNIEGLPRDDTVATPPRDWLHRVMWPAGFPEAAISPSTMGEIPGVDLEAVYGGDPLGIHRA